MQALERPDVRKALETADMVTADGMPIVWLQRRGGAEFAERVYGPDILLALCERTSHQGLRHYFLGGDPGAADELAAAMKQRFPGIQIAGTASPKIVQYTLDTNLVQQILDTSPHVIWVGLGSPKQDLWMAHHKSNLPVLMIGVGAAFDFLTGRKRQAPQWMRQRGLEWLYRLVQEPRRLWRRYVFYNALFLWKLVRTRQLP
ncbi:WecB/TagA/CpsF family glycosyltransferase [Candidatus Flexifilum breve]|uniref:WecB/TagA/CpsF family glycosyltransferase n=1 Tax=Candidatus Flexifilum breve TaxID=3140694 RepID=UPI0031CC79C9